MLNHFQILIQPVILLVEGEVHEFEAVGNLEHGVVGDGTATSAVKSGSVHIDLDFVHHIDVGGAHERGNSLTIIFLRALGLLREIMNIRDAFF